MKNVFNKFLYFHKFLLLIFNYLDTIKKMLFFDK